MLPHGTYRIQRAAPLCAAIDHTNPCVIPHRNGLAVAIHGACHGDQAVTRAFAVAHKHLVPDPPRPAPSGFITGRGAPSLP